MGIRKPAPEGVDPQMLASQMKAAECGQAYRFGCRLITPMYGGGVRAAEVDERMPIRATAIRGQLRFWWRLLARRSDVGQFLSSTDLFERERAIWGGLGTAETLAKSKVVVRVHDVRGAVLTPAAEFLRKPDGQLKSFPSFGKFPGYALFPGQGKVEYGQIKTPPAKLLDAGARWQLLLSGSDLDPSQWKEVLQAVRWWASFGGVGARTRRGCGAVEVRDEKGTVLAASHDEVSATGMRLHFRPAQADAVDAWTMAVEALQRFRQSEGLGRNRGQGNRPGRSLWPEPDAIRRVVRSHAPNHAPIHAAGNCFPRAAFGLPIIFHFKDRGDGSDTTLKPRLPGERAARERMASPLILRPYPSQDGRWYPALLRIDRGVLPTMELSLDGNAAHLPHAVLASQWQGGAWVADVPPMQHRGADALSAFETYFTEGIGAGADAALLAREREPPQEERFTAQLSYNRANGAVTAKQLKTNKSISVTGEQAQALWAKVSDAGLKAHKNGRFIAKAVVLEGRLIRIEENQ